MPNADRNGTPHTEPAGPFETTQRLPNVIDVSAIAATYGERTADEVDSLARRCDEARQLLDEGLDRFLADWKSQAAAATVLRRVGESVTRLRRHGQREGSLLDEHPYPHHHRGWQILVDVGNYHDHAYDTVRWERTWQTLRGLVTDLRPALEHIAEHPARR